MKNELIFSKIEGYSIKCSLAAKLNVDINIIIKA